MSEENEKPALTPASENIWYVLSTIAGVPTKYIDLISEKNGYYWNGVMRVRLGETGYLKLKRKDGKQIELPDLSDADFKSGVFKTTTDFTDAKFLHAPPQFYDASVSQDIRWAGVKFPKPPNDKHEIEAHKNSYERLSLMMSKLEKPMINICFSGTKCAHGGHKRRGGRDFPQRR